MFSPHWRQRLEEMRRDIRRFGRPAPVDAQWLLGLLRQDLDRPILLVPDPVWLLGCKEDDSPPFGIAPGWYNPQQLLELLREKKNDPEAIQFIADLLED